MTQSLQISLHKQTYIKISFTGIKLVATFNVDFK